MPTIIALAKEVKECPTTKSGRRGYSKDLRNKICIAANKYGHASIAEKLKISQSLISRWCRAQDKRPKSSSKAIQSPSKKLITFKEVLSPRPSSLLNQGATVRLISPNGAKLELDSISNDNLSEIIMIFIRGAQ